MGVGGFEPPKAVKPPDLQSGPIVHSGTRPRPYTSTAALRESFRDDEYSPVAPEIGNRIPARVVLGGPPLPWRRTVTAANPPDDS
jgi:hypothetical protein